MKISRLGRFRLTFDYHQFLVYDLSVKDPECEWTKEHADQGFARRESVVCVGTLFQGGTACATVFPGRYRHHEKYERVIAVPFYSPDGKIIIGGLVVEMYLSHIVFLPAGHYKLYVAQWVKDEENEHEGVHLFFDHQKTPPSKSEILVADIGLSPPAVLLESADPISL